MHRLISSADGATVWRRIRFRVRGNRQAIRMGSRLDHLCLEEMPLVSGSVCPFQLSETFQMTAVLVAWEEPRFSSRKMPVANEAYSVLRLVPVLHFVTIKIEFQVTGGFPAVVQPEAELAHQVVVLDLHLFVVLDVRSELILEAIM